jgi:hypothetical protein
MQQNVLFYSMSNLRANAIKLLATLMKYQGALSRYLVQGILKGEVSLYC